MLPTLYAYGGFGGQRPGRASAASSMTPIAFLRIIEGLQCGLQGQPLRNVGHLAAFAARGHR